MASEREVLQILIQTVADLKAAEQTRASLDKTRDTLRSAGKDTAALDAQIKALDNALKSEGASAMRAAREIERQGAAAKGAADSLRDAAKATDALAASQSKLSSGGKTLATKAPNINDTSGIELAGKDKDLARQRLAEASLYSETGKQIQRLEQDALKLNAAGQQAYDTLVKLGKAPSAKADAANDARQQVADQKALADAMAKVRVQSEQSAAARSSAMQNAQAAAVAEAAQAKGRAEVAAVAARYEAADTTEKQRKKRVLDELKESQEKATAAGKRGADNKKELRQLTEGLSSQYGKLGSQLRAVIGPLSAIGAVAGFVASQFKVMFDQIEKDAEAVRKFGNLGDQIDPMKAIGENIDRDEKAFAEKFKAIAAHVNSVSQALADVNDMLLLQQQLNEELANDKLDRKVAEIDAAVKRGDMTPAQGIAAKAEATQQARRDKKAGEFDTMQKQIDAQNAAAEDAARRAEAAKGGLADLKPEEQRQTRATKAATKDAQNVGAAADDKLERLFKAKDLAEYIANHPAQATADLTTIPGQLDMSRLLGRKLGDNENNQKNLEEIEAMIESELKRKADALILQAKMETKLAEIVAKRVKLQEEQTRNEETRVKAEHDAAKLAEKLRVKKEADAKTEPEKTATENLKKDEAVKEAKRAEEITKKKAQLHDKEEEIANTKDVGARAGLHLDKAKIEGEINTLQNADHPERRAEVEAENRRKEAEARRKAREEAQADHEKRFGRQRRDGASVGGASSADDTAAVERASTEIGGQGQSLAAAITEMKDAMLGALEATQRAAEEATAKAQTALDRTDANRLG